MLLLTSLDNQNVLRALEVIVVVLIWLFFLRVIRAVWVEVRPPRVRRRRSEAMDENPAPVPETRRKRRRDFHLEVVEPEPQRGRTYELDTDELTLGRAPGCGVRVEDTYASSIHARLYRQEKTLWVEDLGSTNGTWVNSERIIAPTRLGKGDQLQVGGTVFEVSR